MSTSSRFLRLFAGVALLLSIVFVASGLYFINHAVAPAAPQLLTVRPGAGLHGVARELERQGVVASARGFILLARLRGDTLRIRAGNYDFVRATTPGAVLDRLVTGDVRRLQFTIPEGFDLRQIAARLDAAGVAPAAEVLRLAHDAEFLAARQIPASSLEGYLFPETYTVQEGFPPAKVLEAMLAQTRRQLNAERLAAAAAHGLDPHAYLTLASIVQKEAGNDGEMPLIAAVFLNRLRRGIPLQADPTVIYGLGEAFNGNLTRNHLRQPTPYNTYTRRGLPPGPIASPGAAALQGVAYPAAVDYLYFVARGDGTHAFSATLKEHNRNVQRFQLHR